VPLAIAFLWALLGPPGSGALMIGGLLIGAVSSGLILALFLSTAGAAWDNAKKYIESGHFGGKGSPAPGANGMRRSTISTPTAWKTSPAGCSAFGLVQAYTCYRAQAPIPITISDR